MHQALKMHHTIIKKSSMFLPKQLLVANDATSESNRARKKQLRFPIFFFHLWNVELGEFLCIQMGNTSTSTEFLP